MSQRGGDFATRWVTQHIVSFAPEDDPTAGEAVTYLIEAALKEGISLAEMEDAVGDARDFIIGVYLEATRDA
ncbi:MAG TPA: hypothetical protein VEZ48_06785 [Sphingomonadaceae bacterium]|nr:hypothetical protein [Sphingomonadaceae bacterium]